MNEGYGDHPRVSVLVVGGKSGIRGSRGGGLPISRRIRGGKPWKACEGAKTVRLRELPKTERVIGFVMKAIEELGIHLTQFATRGCGRRVPVESCFSPAIAAATLKSHSEPSTIDSSGGPVARVAAPHCGEEEQLVKATGTEGMGHQPSRTFPYLTKEAGPAGHHLWVHLKWWPSNRQGLATGRPAASPYAASGKRYVTSGWGAIRTRGGVTPTAVFKTAALDHSATHPSCCTRRTCVLSSLRRFGLVTPVVTPVYSPGEAMHLPGW